MLNLDASALQRKATLTFCCARNEAGNILTIKNDSTKRTGESNFPLGRAPNVQSKPEYAATMEGKFMINKMLCLEFKRIK
jgi:hypothetical protein